MVSIDILYNVHKSDTKHSVVVVHPLLRPVSKWLQNMYSCRYSSSYPYYCDCSSTSCIYTFLWLAFRLLPDCLSPACIHLKCPHCSRRHHPIQSCGNSYMSCGTHVQRWLHNENIYLWQELYMVNRSHRMYRLVQYISHDSQSLGLQEFQIRFKDNLNTIVFERTYILLDVRQKGSEVQDVAVWYIFQPLVTHKTNFNEILSTLLCPSGARQ